MLNLIPLGPGEFSWRDKFQTAEYINHRLGVLREAYNKDPDTARRILSYTLPGLRGRELTDMEIRTRLGLSEGEKIAASLRFFQELERLSASPLPGVRNAVRPLVEKNLRVVPQPFQPLKPPGQIYQVKTAGALHGVLMALGGHLGTNALGRAAHHKSNIGEILAHRGLQHGLTGANTQMSPVRRQALKLIFGPEALIPYEKALEAGRHLLEKYPQPENRQFVLQALVSQAKAGKPLPLVGDIVSAMGHEIAGTTPTLSAQGAAKTYGGLMSYLSDRVTSDLQTPGQKIVSNVIGAAPLALAGAADAVAGGGVPLGMIGHAGWNLTRQGIAATPQGKKWAVNQLKQGLTGNGPSPRLEVFSDYAFSPAFLLPRRLGAAIHQQNPVLANTVNKGVDFVHAETLKPAPAFRIRTKGP